MYVQYIQDNSSQEEFELFCWRTMQSAVRYDAHELRVSDDVEDGDVCMHIQGDSSQQFSVDEQCNQLCAMMHISKQGRIQ